MKEDGGGGSDGDPGAVITAPAPIKPRWLDCLILLLAVPMLNLFHLVAMLLVAAAQAVLRALDLPTDLAILMGVGTWGLLLGVLGLLLHAHQTRFRAATIEPTRIIVGLIDPPRGVIIRFDQIVGFRSTGQGVVLVLRGKPWTRWLGPVVACQGELMHRVVERLEAHGVRRIDG